MKEGQGSVEKANSLSIFPKYDGIPVYDKWLRRQNRRIQPSLLKLRKLGYNFQPELLQLSRLSLCSLVNGPLERVAERTVHIGVFHYRGPLDTP